MQALLLQYRHASTTAMRMSSMNHNLNIESLTTSVVKVRVCRRSCRNAGKNFAMTCSQALESLQAMVMVKLCYSRFDVSIIMEYKYFQESLAS